MNVSKKSKRLIIWNRGGNILSWLARWPLLDLISNCIIDLNQRVKHRQKARFFCHWGLWVTLLVSLRIAHGRLTFLENCFGEVRATMLWGSTQHNNNDVYNLFRVVLVFFVSVCCDLEALGFGPLEEVGAARLFDLSNDGLRWATSF